MKKIIQIATDENGLYCLTEDGKVYERATKDKEEINEWGNPQYPRGRTYYKGTIYWKEILEEEKF